MMEPEKEKLAKVLERNGLSRIESRALAAFKDGRPKTLPEIESITGLRQPEVSVAMSRLVGEKWLTVTPVKQPDRGRLRATGPATVVLNSLPIAVRIPSI
jgi:predicted transcriptional regulator